MPTKLEPEDLKAIFTSKVDMKILDAKCPMCNAPIWGISTAFLDSADKIARVDMVFKCSLKITREIVADTYKIAAKCEDAMNIFMQQKIDEFKNGSSDAKTSVEASRFSDIK